jgi:hypothetical protein
MVGEVSWYVVATGSVGAGLTTAESDAADGEGATDPDGLGDAGILGCERKLVALAAPVAAAMMRTTEVT